MYPFIQLLTQAVFEAVRGCRVLRGKETNLCLPWKGASWKWEAHLPSS